jgi:hypothetical protein
MIGGFLLAGCACLAVLVLPAVLLALVPVVLVLLAADCSSSSSFVGTLCCVVLVASWAGKDGAEKLLEQMKADEERARLRTQAEKVCGLCVRLCVNVFVCVCV